MLITRGVPHALRLIADCVRNSLCRGYGGCCYDAASLVARLREAFAISHESTSTPHQSLSQIKSLLAAYSLHPRHRFGQNFLHDADKMARIIAAAELQQDDLVLEVGPGTGALSVRLLAAGAKLVAVEIDRDLEPILRSELRIQTDDDVNAQRATLCIADVLDGKHTLNPWVHQSLSKLSGQASPTFKLVANLPYNVASPLIANLLLAPYETPDQPLPRMTLAIVLIQREVADRLTAPPGGKDYGPLGILVQAMCEVDRVATLPPGCFWPSPKVDSAVVRLRVRSQPMTAQPHQLSKLLHQLFSKRRKQIGSILGRSTVLPEDIDANQRPEQLTVEQLCRLASHLSPG